MGREIRMVPPDWEHPKDFEGHYKPLYDRSYQKVAEKWQQDYLDFLKDPEEQAKAVEDGYPFFWEWDGMPPDREYYRPDWPGGTATAYQIYETVSEGTPVSPVFDTEPEIVTWLIEQGHSEYAASEFVKQKWAPSMTFGPAGVKMDVHTFDD